MLDKLLYEKRKTKLSCALVSNLRELPHIHAECEIVVCYSGKASCFLGGNTSEIGEGDIVFVFPNQVHDYTMYENGKFLVMNFSSDLMPNMGNYFKVNLPKHPIINFSESDALKRLMLEFETAYDSRSEDADLLLLGYLSLAMFLMKPLIDAKPADGLNSSNFEKICNYCIRNYRSKISLDILSQELHLSKQRISHIFNQHMGMTLPQYINFLRIGDACHLLTETSDTITKISEDVGFECLRNFNKVFYDINKMTPSEFRTRQIKGLRDKKAVLV